MPFDAMDHRDWHGGSDPGPTRWQRLTCWASLAGMVAANGVILSLIVLWGLLGIATGSVDCGGMALLTALVSSPFHLSWATARELAAGRRR